MLPIMHTNEDLIENQQNGKVKQEQNRQERRESNKDCISKKK